MPENFAPGSPPDWRLSTALADDMPQQPVGADLPGQVLPVEVHQRFRHARPSGKILKTALRHRSGGGEERGMTGLPTGAGVVVTGAGRGTGVD